LNSFFVANSATINSAASALLDVDVKSIESAITSFAETSAVLMKGLDALSQLHPFVGVAVQAFKLVISFDITRRQNNKKVLAVKLQMQSMMTVLFQLRNVRNPTDKGPDGTPIQDRMMGILQSIANDITACGNQCDVYLKKSFLSKTLKSKIYESRLAGYASKFDDHKKEIVFELHVHTALGVDSANKKLDTQEGHLMSLEFKMEALFKKLDTPREKDVRAFIEEKGGARACIESEGTLAELVSKSGETLAGAVGGGGEMDLTTAKKVLTKELAEDVDEAFRKNMKLFDRKLEMQSRQLADAMSLTGEHIISVLSDGAHKRIVDEDLQALWKDQGWKGSVKARHFVLALNDYYTEKFSARDIASLANSVAGSAPPSPIISPVDGTLLLPAPEMEDDRWALSYINVAHLQPILEAVDDDGTGFVSIKEANDFAMMKPKGWSLLRWVAFWAAGWHISVTWYKNRIYNILEAMMRLIPHVSAGNVNAAGTYFAGTGIRRIELLLRSTKSVSAKDSYGKDDAEYAKLKETKEEIQRVEEKRLESRLDGMLYELDDVATVRLITGPRRIERASLLFRHFFVVLTRPCVQYVYPLLYLLLKRHFDIMRLACVHILDETEWDTMATSLTSVMKVVDERTRTLEAIVKSSSQDVKERLGNFAFGMLLYGPRKRDPINNTIDSFTEEDGYEWDDEDLGPDWDDDDEATIKATLARISKKPEVLNYEIQDEPKGVYDLEVKHPYAATPADPVDGLWVGQLIEPNGTAWEGTLSMVLKREGEKISGAAENFLGLLETKGTGTGVKSGRKVTFKVTWPDGYVAECEGEYDPEGETIKGTWVEKEEDSDSDSDSDSDDSSTFLFRRTPAAAFRFRYTDAEFAANAARARWKFAISATLNEVQRARMTWPYLKKRFEERKRSLELLKHYWEDTNEVTPWPPLTSAERTELMQLKGVLRSCDVRFYCRMAEFGLQKLLLITCSNRDCDSCDRDIRGSHLLCIECIDDKYSNSIDLCAEHADQTPQRGDFVHQRSHLMIKTYNRLHDGDLAWLIPEAKVVAERVKKVYREAHSLLARVEGAADLKPGNHATTKSKKKSKSAQICSCCGEAVSPPYFACIDCVEDTFVCIDCDAKRAKALPDGRNPNHSLSDPLVYIHDSAAPTQEVTQEVKLAELEGKLSGLDSKIANLEEKLERRFTSLEALLTGISEKLLAKSAV
ncbi:hypothetical protein C8F01DRAFT_982091, partial [Mycena amicta]